ncbi:MAG: tRNA dihydrouridine synthase DusB [Thermoflexales bacterium]|nr:tRNA dihydrouridine synthase DusB [Thermoflexales bacterium]
MKLEPTFIVRDIPIYGDLILAPMAGFSDQPYRRLCREFGSAVSCTEFVLDTSLSYGSRRSEQILSFDPIERPVSVQIFGRDEDTLEQAARQVEQLGVDIVDLNLGCSVPKVLKRGAGACLLQDPARIGRIMARLCRTLSAPVTAKMRLGWDESSLNYLEVAKILEDNGAALIAVHGRTQSQNYDSPANWDAIAEVKQAAHVPVIGNGDVVRVADIERIKRHTGCDGVMIARAAIGNPWIFQRRDLEQVPLGERVAVMGRHLDLMVDFYGDEWGALRFRKHVAKYIRSVPDAARWRHQLMACTCRQEFMAILSSMAQAAQ